MRIQVTSFVRPDAIPQLADCAAVMKQITRVHGVTYSTRCPEPPPVIAMSSPPVPLTPPSRHPREDRPGLPGWQRPPTAGRAVCRALRRTGACWVSASAHSQNPTVDSARMSLKRQVAPRYAAVRYRTEVRGAAARHGAGSADRPVLASGPAASTGGAFGPQLARCSVSRRQFRLVEAALRQKDHAMLVSDRWPSWPTEWIIRGKCKLDDPG